MNCLKKLGVDIAEKDGEIIVKGHGLKLKNLPMFWMRVTQGRLFGLLSGILAGQNFTTKIIGDESLSKRPMKRIIEPLEKMGAKMKSNNGYLPIEIEGGNLKPINYESKISFCAGEILCFICRALCRRHYKFYGAGKIAGPYRKDAEKFWCEDRS